MVEAKLLRKKLKNGLIVDKWDLVTIIEKQQAEIERLSNDNYKFIKAMANKDSHIESLKQLLNDSALRKASEK